MSALEMQKQIKRIKQLIKRKFDTPSADRRLHTDRLPIFLGPLYLKEEVQREANIIANALELIEGADQDRIEDTHQYIYDNAYKRFEYYIAEIREFFRWARKVDADDPSFMEFCPPEWSLDALDTNILPCFVSKGTISESHFVNLVGYASICRPPLYPWQKFDRENDSILPLENILRSEHNFDLNRFEKYRLDTPPLVAMTERSNGADRWVHVRGIRLLLKNGADPNRQLSAGGMTPLARIATLKEVICKRRASDLLKAVDSLLEACADPHLEVHLSCDSTLKASPLELFAEWKVPADARKTLSRLQKSNVEALGTILAKHGLELPEPKGISSRVMAATLRNTNETILSNDRLQTRFGDKYVNNVQTYISLDEKYKGRFHVALSYAIRSLEMMETLLTFKGAPADQYLLNTVAGIEFLLAEIERSDQEAAMACDEIWGAVCDTLDHVIPKLSPVYDETLGWLDEHTGNPQRGPFKENRERSVYNYALLNLGSAVAAYEYSKRFRSILDEPLVAMSLLNEKYPEVQYSNIVIARYLIHRGFNVNAVLQNSSGGILLRPPIWLASIRNEEGLYGVVPRLIRLLLENGANANETRVQFSSSPLAQIIKCLGACPERADDALTAARHLLAAGAVVDRPIKDDGTKKTIRESVYTISMSKMESLGLGFPDLERLARSPFDYSFDCSVAYFGNREKRRTERQRGREMAKLMVQVKCARLFREFGYERPNEPDTELTHDGDLTGARDWLVRL